MIFCDECRQLFRRFFQQFPEQLLLIDQRPFFSCRRQLEGALFFFFQSCGFTDTGCDQAFCRIDPFTGRPFQLGMVQIVKINALYKTLIVDAFSGGFPFDGL